MATFTRSYHPTIQPSRQEAMQAARVFGISAYKHSKRGTTEYVVRVDPYHFVPAKLIASNNLSYTFEYTEG